MPRVVCYLTFDAAEATTDLDGEWGCSPPLVGGANGGRLIAD